MHRRLAGIERLDGLAVDPQPHVDILFAPDGIPVARGVDAGVAQKLCALPHALLKFNRERNQRGQRKFKTLETTKRKADVEGALRLASIPALAGGDLVEQAANQIARLLRASQSQEEIASHRQVIATQNESLNIGGVEFTHCDHLS